MSKKLNDMDEFKDFVKGKQDYNEEKSKMRERLNKVFDGKMSWIELYDYDFEKYKKNIPESYKEQEGYGIHYRFEKCLDFIEEGAKVLDIGIGDGYFCHILKKKGYKPTGFDVSEEAVNYAKEHTDGIKFKQGNVCEKLPFDDNTFDAVTALELIEHLKEPVKALKEMKRVLKKGGVLLASVPIKKQHKDALHLRAFNYYEDGKGSESLIDLFEKVSEEFKISEIDKYEKRKRKKTLFFIRLYKGEKDEQRRKQARLWNG